MSETVAPAAAAPAAVAPAVGAAAAPGGNPEAGTAPAAGADAAPAGTTLLGDAPGAADKSSDTADAPVESTDAKPGEPVVYTPFTIPEGIDKDAPVLSAFAEEAAKLGLPQEQAQKIVTAVGERVAAVLKEQTAAQMSAWVATNERWQAEIRADKDIGGSKFEAVKTAVAKLFDDYVGPINAPERKALNEALLHTGAGNNPAIVSAFAKIAAAHTEGGFVSGSPGRGPVDRAALMYPTMGQPNGAARGNQG